MYACFCVCSFVVCVCLYFCLFFVFFECCAKHNLVCFFRIRPVQRVVNRPTQLSGRGFPLYILYDISFVATLCVVGTPKWKSGRVI